MAGTDNIVWLTYDEIAERLGIERESARQQVKRKRWARQPGNDGKVRIGVPEEVLASGSVPDTEGGTDPDQVPEHDPVPSQVHAALEDHIASLKAMVAKAETAVSVERERADREHGRAADLAGRLADVETARAALEGQATAMKEILTSRDIEMTRERDRVTLLSAKLVEATARATEAAGTETDLKNRLEAASAELHALRSRSWWRRLVG